MKNRVPRRLNLGIALIITVALLTLNIAPVVCAQGAATRVETFDLALDGQVQVENLRGATSVEVWNEQTVRVVAERKTPPSLALEPADVVLMSAQNTVIIQCRQSSKPGRVDLTVYVPAYAHVQLTGGTWPVEVNGPLASAVVETTGGHISYQLPRTDDAQVVMRSARGVVKSTVELTDLERVGTSSLQGKLGAGAAPIILNSRTGNITLSPGASFPTIAKAAYGRPAPHTSGDQQNRRAPEAADQGYRGDYSRQYPSTQSNRDPDLIIPGSPRPGYGSSRGSVSSGGSRSTGDWTDLAGQQREDDNNSTNKGGPILRPREEKVTSNNGAGFRVRIIPADSTASGARRPSNPIYDDPVEEQTRKPQQGGNRSSSPRSDQATYDPQTGWSDARKPARVDPAEEAPVDSSGSGRRGDPPPSIRRSPNNDSSNDTAQPAAHSAENDEIVLNSAVVNLNVSVTDRSGLAMANLRREDFEVYENNERQQVEFFAPTTTPFNLVLLLDLSGSIKDKLDVVKAAALRFIEVIGPQDRVAVLTFTHEVRVVSQLTANRDALRKRIKEIERPEGGTAFYDAMWWAMLDTLRGTAGQRNAIVVMTDGVDSSLDRYNPAETRVTFNQLARKLEESDVIVFPIYLDTEYEEVFLRGNGSSESYAVARTQLEKIAELSGGQYFKAEQAKDLSGVYKQVAAALRTLYSVGYYPTNSERDGTYRRVRVGVTRQNAAVRARKGYYAK
ncbi:MAG TPA: VWA domain-containing protein [Blastocatellia bacterium]|nr:VWA domain-containing protein [Blastocatellia bacterium]